MKSNSDSKKEQTKPNSSKRSSSNLSTTNKQFEAGWVKELLSSIKSHTVSIKQSGGNIVSTFRQRLSSINNIAKANEEISAGIEKQLIATDKCTELAAAFQEQFENMLNSSRVLAEKAQLTDQKLSSQIVIDKKTQQHFYSIMDSVAKLSGSAGSITGIVKTILRIAQQINLLSINATIEAARAGSAGRGFAAVAEEIKRLTYETKTAAEDISELISTVSSDVQHVQKLSNSAKVDFLEQEEKIEVSNRALAEIHCAMGDLVDQQKQVSSLLENLLYQKNELVSSITEIAEITEHNAATSQMVSSISMEQSSRDALVLDMLHAEHELIDSLYNQLTDIDVGAKAQKKCKIGFTSLEQSQFYKEVEQAAKTTADNLNIDIVFNTPKRFNAEEQIQIFKDFVQQKVDGIIVVPSDAVRFAPLINDARKQGIYVACVDIDVPKSSRNFFITSNSYVGGKIAGEAAVRHLKGKGKIVVLLCAAAVPTVQERYKGFYNAVSRYPDITIVRKEEQSDTDPTKTRNLMNNLLSLYPDFDLMYVVTGEAGEMAVDLFMAKRLNKKLIVLSLSDKVTEAVRQGIVSSQIMQRNTLWGELSVAYINRLLKGEDVPASVDTGMYELNKANLPIFVKYGNMAK